MEHLSRRRAVACSALAALLCLGVASIARRDATRPRDEIATRFRLAADAAGTGAWLAPEAASRCAFITEEAAKRDDPDAAPEDRRAKFAAVAADPNSFYRGTAYLFWHDFVRGGWGDFDVFRLAGQLADGSPLQRTSTWTWVTGDQHLSNFGVWMARDGEVVLGVNDFDEAVVYDFQVDVWRAATSIYNHALTNGLGSAKAEAAVLTFCDMYVRTARGYVGNEDALTAEVTKSTTRKGSELHDFLKSMSGRDEHRAVDKFTHFTNTNGRGDPRRHFDTRPETGLEAVDAETKAEVVAAMTQDRYGATLTKVGWHVLEWDDESMEVLDVARRVGAGVGSFGVDRYYVLLAGGESLLEADDDDDDDAPAGTERRRRAVILDVKEEPTCAARAAFNHAGDAAWYDMHFPNEAERAVKAQRQLTSFTDPFAGWAEISGKDFVVRERSPYKASFDLGRLETYEQFAEYVESIAFATATAHVRGGLGNAPATFKEVVDSVFGRPYQLETWAVSVARVAAAYREQVLLDYACYWAYANATLDGGL